MSALQWVSAPPSCCSAEQTIPILVMNSQLNCVSSEGCIPQHTLKNTFSTNFLFKTRNPVLMLKLHRKQVGWSLPMLRKERTSSEETMALLLCYQAPQDTDPVASTEKDIYEWFPRDLVWTCQLSKGYSPAPPEPSSGLCREMQHC